MTHFLYSDLRNLLESDPHRSPFQDLPESMSSSLLALDDPLPPAQERSREATPAATESSPPLPVHIHRSVLAEGRMRPRGHLSSSPFAQVFDLRKGKWILIPVKMAEKLLAIGRVAFTETGEPLLPPSNCYGMPAKAVGNEG